MNELCITVFTYLLEFDEDYSHIRLFIEDPEADYKSIKVGVQDDHNFGNKVIRVSVHDDFEADHYLLKGGDSLYGYIGARRLK